jgi:hypothetical protein
MYNNLFKMRNQYKQTYTYAIRRTSKAMRDLIFTILRVLAVEFNTILIFLKIK